MLMVPQHTINVCKVQIKTGEHLLPHQAQTNQAENCIKVSKNMEQNVSLNCQCNDFQMIYNLINQSENLINEKCKTDTNEKSSDQ